MTRSWYRFAPVAAVLYTLGVMAVAFAAAFLTGRLSEGMAIAILWGALLVFLGLAALFRFLELALRSLSHKEK